MQLYFTEDQTLVNATPNAGSIAIGTPVTAFAGTTFGLTFETEPLEQAIYLEPQGITADVWLRGTGPLVSNGQFDMGLWLGSPLAMPGFAFVAHDPLIAPNTPTQFTFNVPFQGTRGLVIPAGQPIRIILAGDFTAQDTLVYMDTGGATPSGIRFSARTYTVDPLEGVTTPEPEFVRGQLTAANSAFFCGVTPGSQATHALTVNDATAFLQVALIPITATIGQTDLDLTLRDGTDILSASLTPSGNEGIFLADIAADGLAGRDLTVLVTACTGGQVTYDVAITEGRKAAEPAMPSPSPSPAPTA